MRKDMSSSLTMEALQEEPFVDSALLRRAGEGDYTHTFIFLLQFLSRILSAIFFGLYYDVRDLILSLIVTCLLATIHPADAADSSLVPSTHTGWLITVCNFSFRVSVTFF